jgi:hypothetical protein
MAAPTALTSRLPRLLVESRLKSKAVSSVLALGPRPMRRYFLYPKIAERAFPRLKALVTGNS